MNERTKAVWLFIAAVLLIGLPYVLVFGVGSYWMWRNGWVWIWALGTGLPTVLGLLLLERARRILFPPAVELSHPPALDTGVGKAAQQAVQAISLRVQAEDPQLDQPEVFEKFVPNVLWEIMETVARQYHPDVEQPVLQAPVARIAGVVELVARDFRRMFIENVPWGNQMTPDELMRWKKRGDLAWQVGMYLWQLNRLRRLCVQPATALVQELQDHLGQNVASKSVGGLKQWAIDYCITKAGDYAVQLYSGSFVLDEEHQARISPAVENVPFAEEPLQTLVVGQVKAGKSSLINVLLGEMRAPIDVLPATDDVGLYECRPEGFPLWLLRDTPGYSTGVETSKPFVQLVKEIEECDLLMLVCSAQTAARIDDRELLQHIHEHYRQHPESKTPPIVYVLTHSDAVPPSLHGELIEAVAQDLGIAADQVVLACTRQGESSDAVRLWDAIRTQLPEAERRKCLRCIRQIRKQRDDDQIVHQILNGLRLTGGWLVGRK
jgi:uncharacterized protein